MSYEQRLTELWRALPLASGERLPRRARVKAAFINSMMSNCWQLDWQTDDRLIIEYEGAAVDAMWGDAVTGEDYLANYSPDQRTRLLAFYHLLFDTPCGATVVRAIQREGGGTYRLTTHFVPMLSKDGERRVIFGTSEMEGNYRDTCGRLNFGGAVTVGRHFIDLGHGVPEAEARLPNS
jgi:hypothetical protein